MAYITLSSFRDNPDFQDFFCLADLVVCEVIHIRRVDGGALYGVAERPHPKSCKKMTDCCIPQQNPALYLFTHRLVHSLVTISL
ncbi:hypothetical protein DD595_25775 [Enterobacter cloacae complex sp. 4DZ3-17B2]|nr:hypothetical protein DD595_25775 [Enterobacter cloacae complex sp. 4DZ3-17B2]